MDSGQTSQAFVDPGKTPDWYLDHAVDCHRDAEKQLRLESNPNKVIIFLRQCKYLVDHLGTAIHISRKSWERSVSPEHKAECRGALELLCRLAKEVGTFVWECCNERWMQTALSPVCVPKRVSLWRLHLKVCSELLCNNNRLGVAWLTVDQDGDLGEEEWLTIKKMASADECDLRRFLESTLDQSNESKLNILVQNVELGRIILKRLKACQAMPTVGSPQSSAWEDTYRCMMEPWKVDFESLLQKRRLSKGGINLVYEGEWFEGIKVAIKHLDLGPTALRRGMAARPSHPNIVSFLGYCEKSGYEDSTEKELNCLLFEYMDEDLMTLMERRMQEDGNRECPFNIWEACDIMLQVGEGLRYMHQNRALHKYLKSEKILVKRLKDDRLEYICVKVSGSELAKWIERSITNSTQTLNVGVSRWMAPELVCLDGQETPSTPDKLKHPFKSDVYSFAMICFEILTGELPFSDGSLSGVRRKALEGIRPTLPPNTPQSLKNLIKLCWDPNPILRPSFAEICKELQYIKCSLLLEPQDHTPQLPIPVPKPLHLPLQVSKFKGEYSSLKVVRKLGSGGSDMVTVFLSTWLQSKKEVAQKRFMGSHNKCFKNEVSIMADLEHPNVVRLLHYATNRRSCSIVMELMDGDLHDLMDGSRFGCKETPTGPFSMADAVHVILHIAQGMQYVHGKYVVHRDLKSCNILIKKASWGQKLELKVADFGVSMKLKPWNTLLSKERSGVGTMRWMAPEVTSMLAFEASSTYDPFKSDVFSFGMLCYEILVGRVPFYQVEDLNIVRQKVLDGERPTLQEWTPSYLKDLIEKCWAKEPSERPTFTYIVGELTKRGQSNRRP